MRCEQQIHMRTRASESLFDHVTFYLIHRHVKITSR